jgi:hypoxanthine phosphoribosyltransferase
MIPLQQALANSSVVFDRAHIEQEIRRIAHKIDGVYHGKERPVFLTVMHGGLQFAGLLSLECKTDFDFDYLHATRYRGATTGSGLAWLHKPATPLQGRRVLIADDILDEGHTLKAIRDWCEDQGAIDIHIAVLARKVHDRCVEDIRADFIALDVPDQYVYGFGMDFQEQGRNLPAIYAWTQTE